MAWDGDIELQALIAGAVDLAHSAFANLLNDAVVRNRLADHGNTPVARHPIPHPHSSQRE